MRWNRQIKEKASFWAERIIIRGLSGRLVFIGVILVLLTTLAGAALWLVGDPQITTFSGAAWWAFLRLTDPGYLGDDQGLAKRLISTLLTGLGLAIFVGGLVALVTQWLTDTVRRFERGLTPIRMRDHVLILGWTERTVGVVRELLRSQPKERSILRLRRRKHLQIVVLVENLDGSKMHEFQVQLGDQWNAKLVTLRSGTPLRHEHLERVEALRAAVIVLPGADFDRMGVDAVDTRTIKTIMTIGNALGENPPEELPLLIAEVYDSRKIPIARAAYSGPMELIASDRVTSSLMAQNIRHLGLSYVYSELLDQEGNELYIRQVPELVGQPFHALYPQFPCAIPIGVVHQSEVPDHWEARLCPPLDYTLLPSDHLVLIAEDFSSCDFDGLSQGAPLPQTFKPYAEQDPGVRRVLIFGWSHMIVTLLEELDRFESHRHEVVILSSISIKKRKAQISGYDLDLHRVDLTHVVGDYTLLPALRSVKPHEFGHIILLASDWVATSEEADARTLVGYLLLRQTLLERLGPKELPEILVELTDADSAPLLLHERAEAMVSAVLEGHILAQVIMRRELRAVFDVLFGPERPAFDFRPAHTYGADLPHHEWTFRQLQARALEFGEILIGIRTGELEQPNGGVVLNPSPQSVWKLQETEDLIVLVP